MISSSREIARSVLRPAPGLQDGNDAARMPRRLARRIGAICIRGIRLLRGSGPLPPARKLAVTAMLILASGTAAAEPLVQVYAIRGLAGVIFSRGLNNLCDEIANIPQAACAVEDFYDTGIEGRASASMAAGQRIVLVGHSLGAHAALHIAAALKGTVSLIVTIDPNWYPPPPPVPENAEIVLNYYQNYDVLGRATLRQPPDFQGKLHQFPRSEPHIVIERSADIHAEIITRVRDILASLNPMPLGHMLPPFGLDRRSR